MSRPLVVGLDVSALSPGFKDHATRGLGRHVAGLSRALGELEGDGLEIRRFGHGVGAVRGLAAAVEHLPRGRRVLRQHVVVPATLRGLGADLVHFPAHIDAPAWSHVPTVVTAHDLIPLRDAVEQRPGPLVRLRLRVDTRAIRRAARVLTGSVAARRDLVELVGVPESRIDITPHGIDAIHFASPEPGAAEELRRDLGIAPDRPVILYLGGIDPHKNTAGLVDVAAAVARERVARAESRPVLIIAGDNAKSSGYPALMTRIAAAGLAEDVRMPGFVPDATLPALYALSDVFVFPSLREGFGLPPLEALAAGLPVVSSTADSLSEVLGDAADLVDPRDTAGMVRAVARAIDRPDPARRAAGIARARRFTWEETARLTVAAYERAAAEIRPRRRARGTARTAS